MTSAPAHPHPATPHADAPADIVLDDVCFAYGDNPVIEHAAIRIRHGEFIAVLGPNGGGKSTLLKLMLGLLQPASGTVQVLGTTPREALSRIGYVPQYSTARLDFPVSVLDTILMGQSGRGRGFFARQWSTNRESLDRARHALAQVGLEGMESRPYGALSGGQRQRALVARALMGDPPLLLMDEPTASIDPQGTFCFFEFLATLRGPRTIVVVSHDLSISGAGCDGVIFVNRSVKRTEGKGLTPDLLHMLYGQHDRTCPMGAFIQSVSTLFPPLPHQGYHSEALPGHMAHGLPADTPPQSPQAHPIAPMQTHPTPPEQTHATTPAQGLATTPRTVPEEDGNHPQRHREK